MSKYGIKPVDLAKIMSGGVKPGELGTIFGTDNYIYNVVLGMRGVAKGMWKRTYSMYGFSGRKISPKYNPTEHIFHDIHLGANGYVRHKARCGLVVGDLDTERPETFVDDSRYRVAKRCDKCLDLLTDLEWINSVSV